MGVILTVVFEAKGPEIMRSLGLKQDTFSKAEKGLKRLIKDWQQTAGVVADGMEEKVEETGKRVKWIVDDR